jgi:peptidoglycan/xylan/chitin deacetylase (PgdA/CDA1 family)
MRLSESGDGRQIVPLADAGLDGEVHRLRPAAAPLAETLPILMYHHIAPPPPGGTPLRNLFVSPARFRRQMRTLKQLGYRGCSVAELIPRFLYERPGKYVGITFDDGYEDVYANALPVLEETGFTATAYFVSREIGGFNRWDSDLRFPMARCMSLQQLRQWKTLGHEIGGHTLEHRRLEEIALDEAWRQIADCRHELEDMSGERVEAFSYPYGSFSGATSILARKAGFTSAVTTLKKRAAATDDPFFLPRFNVRTADTLVAFLWKCLLMRD